ncbi:MAG TPA: hypothetical protein VFG10_07550 [Saprospiraceae bacterium]|nr:hypothetical protein [Saprospiraceae bacterium]
MSRRDLTKGLIIVLCSLLTAINFSLTIDQKPDLLIIGQDTLFLRSFPLEELGFEIRPYRSGDLYVPNLDCLREYQAIWKVIDKKLFLAEIVKDNEFHDKVDIPSYFEANGYKPIIIDGLVFADWVTIELSTYPKNYGHWGCYSKAHKNRKWKRSLAFEKGVVRYSKFGNG